MIDKDRPWVTENDPWWVKNPPSDQYLETEQRLVQALIGVPIGIFLVLMIARMWLFCLFPPLTVHVGF